jgi:hypothetical protein
MSIGQQQPSRQSVVRQLATIRIAFLGAVVMITALGMLVLFPHPGPTWGAAVAGAVSLGAVAIAITVPDRTIRPLAYDTSSPSEVAAARIRTTAFVTLAITEFPMMAGLAVSFVADGWLPVAVGGACALVAILALGPSESRVSTWIDLLEADGVPSRL